MDKTVIVKILRRMLLLFTAMLFLGNTSGCADAKKEEEKRQDEAMPESVMESENAEEDCVNTQIIGNELEENIPWESMLYRKYEQELNENDRDRSECVLLGENGWEQAQDCYRETISETCFGQCNNRIAQTEDMSNRFSGILAVEERESAGFSQGFGMRIVISEGEKIREYTYYDSHKMRYMSCRETEAAEGDAPEYQVCREVLGYRKLARYGLEADSVWEESINEYVEKIEGEIKEYCIIDHKVYQIDREGQRLLDVTGQLDIYMVKWLEYEAERVSYRMKVTTEAAERVEELLPDGYSLKGDNYVAVCDLNHDGTEDYVAIAGYETVAYEGYTFTAGDMWMFLSDGVGGYDRKILAAGLYHCSMEFVADGVLMCENWVERGNYGPEPWETDYFVYDRGDEDFYISKAQQCNESAVLMESRETIGEIAIGDYYRYGLNYNGLSSSWEIREYRIFLEEGNYISFADSACYKNVDQEKERFVNDEIFRIENIVSEGLRSYFNEMDYIMIGTDIRYLSPRIFSGCIRGDVKLEEEHFPYNMPIIMDVENGEILDITEMISKEEMLRICHLGMKDLFRNVLAGEDAVRVLRLIEEEYENACRVTSSGEVLMSMNERRISFFVTAWGVQMLGIDAEGTISVRLDKEDFYDTPLWYYMEPDYYGD